MNKYTIYIYTDIHSIYFGSVIYNLYHLSSIKDCNTTTMGNLCGSTANTTTNGSTTVSRQSTVDVDKEIFGQLIGTIRDQRWEDNYKIVKKLGAGITGAVHVVEHKERKGQKYALKSVNLKKLDPAQLKELRNEVALLKKLDHPHIVRLYECYETDKSMDLIFSNLRRALSLSPTPSSVGVFAPFNFFLH